jgi:hypothetical protein
MVIALLAAGGMVQAAEPAMSAPVAAADLSWSNLSPAQQQLLSQFE